MRNMNCQNFRREIDEAGSTDFLSGAALAHLKTCAACETLSRQQTRLLAIVSGLGTVEAPGDFDFRLRARLAEEKRLADRALPFNSLSFGLRSIAVAAMLLLIGAAVVFVAFKSNSNRQLAEGDQTAPKSAGQAQPIQNATAPGSDRLAEAPPKAKDGSEPLVAGTPKSVKTPRLPGTRRELAGVRTGKRFGTQELSSTKAPVLTRDDQLAGSYPTEAFPINASNQSLKVSVNNSRGASRTISLPSVSFGSQRTLSQTASPLLASARDTW